MPGLQSPPRAIFTQIQENLKDRYRSGFPVLKELIQNSEDARATAMRVRAMSGWLHAQNPLLRVPGLLVANNGRFEPTDREGLLSFGASGKGDRPEEIGRFGFGQKAVFHLCDAFVGHAVGHPTEFSQVINPCLGIVPSSRAREWDTLTEADSGMLEAAVPDFPKGFILWIPLRCEAILPTPELFFTEVRPTTEDLVREFLQHEHALRQILASLRNIDQFEVVHQGEMKLSLRRSLMSSKMLGPGLVESSQDRRFGGTVTTGDEATFTYVGREAESRSEALRTLVTSNSWPRELVPREDRIELVPKKAAAHGAVVLASWKRTDGESPSHSSVDWGVFLPVSEAATVTSDSRVLKLLLHGYFFVDAGRRYIDGFQSDLVDESLSVKWNTTLRDEVVLPLLPLVLHDALESDTLSSDELTSLLRELKLSSFGRKHLDHLISSQSLVRVLGRSGAAPRWRLVPPGTSLRPVPLPGPVGQGNLDGEVFGALAGWAEAHGLTLVCGLEASLAPERCNWVAGEIEDLLESLEPSTFLNTGLTRTLADFLDLALAGSRLSREAANVLLTKFRQAVGREANLASDDAMRRLWNLLPAESVVSLPAAGRERYVLRALAESQAALTCLREEWLPSDVAVSKLAPTEGVPLLRALQSLMEHERRADAAGAAALALVSLALRHTRHAAISEEFAELPCVRASDGTGTTRPVSLTDLLGAVREQRLFKDSPRVRQVLRLLGEAAPGARALYVSGPAAELLEKMGEPFRLVSQSNEAFARLVLRATSFGQGEARGPLLATIFDGVEESEAMSGLRVLAAGDHGAVAQGAALIALKGAQSRLDELALRLLEGSTDEFLVEGEVTSDLTARQRATLGISDWDDAALGGLLVNNRHQLHEIELDEETVGDLLKSNVPDADLRRLPLLLDQSGQRREPTRLWRETLDWPIPVALSGLVMRLKLPDVPEARQRAEKLVNEWTPRAQLELTQSQPEAHRFVQEILSAISKLPPLGTDRLAQAEWIPDVHGDYWRPQDVLSLPADLRDAVQTCLSTRPMPFTSLTAIDPSIRDHSGFKRLQEAGVIPAQSESIDCLLQVIAAESPVGFLGAHEGRLAAALTSLANSGSHLGLPGWPLLAVLLRLGGRNASDVLAAFRSADQTQVDVASDCLNALARLCESGIQEAWTAYSLGFKQVAEWPEVQRQRVLGRSLVWTEAGSFRQGDEVVAFLHATSPSHSLSKELLGFLPRLLSEPPGASRDAGTYSQQRATTGADLDQFEGEVVEGLGQVLRYASPHVPHNLLALLAGLLGRSRSFKDLVLANLMEIGEGELTRLWRELEETVESRFDPRHGPTSVGQVRNRNFVVLTAQEIDLDTVEAETISGQLKRIPTQDLQPLDALSYIHNSGYNFQLKSGHVRRIALKVATPETLSIDSEQVKRLCLNIAEVVIGFPDKQQACFDELSALADRCARPDQTTVDQVQDEIRDQLPRVLRELRPKADSHIRNALDKYDDSIQALLPGEQADGLHAAKLELWQRVNRPEVYVELLAAVRASLLRNGYDTKRTIFELYQNADDAYSQRPIEGEARFRLQPVAANRNLLVLHWGRFINHLGANADEGRRQGWHRDLFNMLQMNLSEKGENSTGRFGLGFKSVHLMSKDVGIASRFIACRVRGGMLPEVWEDGRELSSDNTLGGRPATVIELVTDENCEAEMRSAGNAFLKAARWLPAMSRAIRTIEIAEHGSWSADLSPTASDKVRVVRFSGSSQGRALALELNEQTTLFLHTDNAGPAPIEAGVPRLWQLAPLEEELVSGWLMNSWDFRVDPGRGRLSRTIEERRSEFERLGDLLGHRLLDLFDLASQDWPGLAELTGLTSPDPEVGLPMFVERLFELFVSDLDDTHARNLHSSSRGIGRLIRNRQALPTGLPSPFDRLVSLDSVKFALSGALSEPELITGLEDWESIQGIRSQSVSPRTAELLARLGLKRPDPYGLEQLLRQEIGIDLRVGPELAWRLGQLVSRSRLATFSSVEQTRIHDLLREVNFLMEDGTWRKAALTPPHASIQASVEDSLVHGFAPNSAVAARAYEGAALDFYRLAAEQSGFQRTARAYAEWAVNTSDLRRRQAFLRYIVDGRQGNELASELRRLRIPWVPDSSSAMRGSELVAGWEEAKLVRLLSLLYVEENLARWAVDADLTNSPYEHDEEATHFTGDLLEEVHGWWGAVRSEKSREYDRATYPSAFDWTSLRDGEGSDDREAWFTLFALGVFRTIGRTTGAAHRNFIESAQQEGWWAAMAEADLPTDARPWLDRLEHLARANAWRIDFPQWRRALADLYVVARWLPDYVDLFRRLPALARSQPSFSLSDAWRPSASPLWQRRGLEGAPLSQSLGYGANWMIREAIRHGFWSTEDATLMYPYAWSANERIRSLIEGAFGQSLDSSGVMDISPTVYRLLQQRLGDRADYFGDLDLPLQLWRADSV